MGFDPVTAGIMAGGSALLGAAGKLSEGSSKARAANYSAQVAENNKIIANQGGDYALAAGQAQAEAVSRKGAVRGGAIKAAQAANGVDVNSGSAATVQESNREASRLDTLTTINNAELEAYGYRAKATGYEATAKMKRAEAEQAKIGSYFDTAAGLLGSASAIGGKWGGSGTNPNTSGEPMWAPDDI